MGVWCLAKCSVIHNRRYFFLQSLGAAAAASMPQVARTGKKPVADITIGATAAVTAIMGRESIYQKRVVSWSELGVKVEWARSGNLRFCAEERNDPGTTMRFW